MAWSYKTSGGGGEGVYGGTTSGGTAGAAGEVEKAAKSKIAGFIFANLAWIVPTGIILVMVVMIAMAIMGALSQGSTGRVASTLPDPNNPRDMAIVQEGLAAMGDVSSGIRAAGILGDDIVSNIDKVARESKEAGETATNEKFEGLKETALSSLGTASTGSGARDLIIIFSLCDDLTLMTEDELVIAYAAYNQLKGTNLTYPSFPLPAGYQKFIDPELCKNAPTPAEKEKYNEEITNIVAGLQQLSLVLASTASPRIILSGKDKYYWKNNQIDLKIMSALIYLTTPANLGGAGFRKIKVKRLKAQYDTNNRKFSNEWNGSGETTDKEERAISAHWDGAAMDIASIDMVNRQQYKKRVRRPKKIPYPPVDIEVVRQSTKGGKTLGSSSDAVNGSSFGNMFGNQGTFDFMALLAESTGYNLSGITTGAGSFTEIIKMLGLLILNQELGLSIDADTDNSTPEKMFKNIGAQILADCTGLSKNGVKGGTYDEVGVNIGREEAAQSFGLPELSFSGKTSGELFNNIGKRKIEDIFDLYSEALDRLDINSAQNVNYFTYFIGGAIIEKRLGLPQGSFDSNDFNTIKNVVGPDKFDKMRENPPFTDSQLNISPNKGYTSRFLHGTLSPIDYKTVVGKTVVDAYYTNFHSYTTYTVYEGEPSGYSSYGNIYTPQYTPIPTAESTNSSDEVWGLPTKEQTGNLRGTLERIIINDFSVFYDIGINEIAKKLTTNEAEKFVVKSWFTTFKNQPLENLRYKKSKVSEKVVVKTLEQLRDPNLIAIAFLRTNLAIENGRLPGLRSDLYHNGVMDQDIARAINTTEKSVARLEDAILLEGVKLEQKDGKEVVDESGWSLITEDELIANASLGFPSGMLADLFTKDKVEEVFSNIGLGKVSNVELRQSDPERYDENIQAKLNFLYEQQTKNELKIEELQAKIDALPFADLAGEEAQQLARDLATYERTLAIWNREIALTEKTVAEEKSDEADLRQRQKENLSLNIDCSNIDTRQTIENFSDLAISIGIRKFEEALGLPSGSINPIYFSNNQDYTLMGRKQIEETLNLKANSFRGNNLKELRVNMGGDATFIKALFPKQNTEYVLNNLPITEGNRVWFKSISKATDDVFSIDNETTYNLLAENITPDKYCEKVGRGFMEKTIPDSLSKILNVDVGGYRITGEDVRYLMQGDFLAVAIKVGCKMVDESLNLPYGTIKALINNPQSCAVTNQSTGRVEGCIESLLAANGQHDLAMFMGVYGNTLLSDNLAENIGQGKFESVLNTLHPSPTLPEGWFAGSSLQTDIPLGLAKKESPEACGAISDSGGPFSFTNPACNEQVAEFKKKIVQKLGFNYNLYKLANLKTIDYNVSGTIPYSLTRSIDRALGIVEGLTGQMLNETLSIDDYKSKIQKAYSKDQTESWVYSNIPGDLGEYLRENHISVGQVKEYYRIATDPVAKGALEFLINQRKNYLDAEDKGLDEELIGEIIIEQTLGGIPGWFDAITKEALRLKIKNPTTGTVQKEPIAQTNEFISGPNGIFSKLADKKIELDPFIVSLAGGNATSAKTQIIANMKKSQLERIALNSVFVKKLNRGELLNTDKVIAAEYEVLRRFGINPDPNINNFDLVQINTYEKGDEVFDATANIDLVFNIKAGSTLDLIQNRIDITGYKERVKKAYLGSSGGEALINELMPQSVNDQLYRYGLSVDTIMDAINNPDSLDSEVFFNILSSSAVSEMLGRPGNPVTFSRGEFPDNYAQKLVEETLGLFPGSFSPSSTITKVMEKNGAKKFANSFHIYLNNDKADNAYAQQFLEKNVFVKTGESFYWSDPISLKRAALIDGLFKIENSFISPTQALLQGDLKITEYLITVKNAQFRQFQNSTYAAEFASFLMSGDPESSGTARRQASAAALAGTIATLIQDPDSLRRPSIQAQFVTALAGVWDINIDDRLGFSAGTTERLIMNPDRSRSILMAEGMRAIAERVLFGEQDYGSWASEDLKNSLLVLFQYYVPGINPGDYYVRTTPANDCAIPPIVTPGQWPTNMTEEEGDSWIENHRSTCQHYITRRLLGNIIEEQTTITASNGRVIPGITLNDQQLRDLTAGNTRVIASVGIAYTINALKVVQNSDPGDPSINLIPDGFWIDPQEAYDAIYGGSALKERAGNIAGEQYATQWVEQQAEGYDNEWRRTHGGADPPGPFDTSHDAETYWTGLIATTAPPSPLQQYAPGEEGRRAKQYYSGGKEAVQKAQNDAPRNARRLLQYRYYDAQLMTLAQKNNMPPIPVGFSEAMLGGDPDKQQDMYLKYSLSVLVSATFFKNAVSNASDDQKTLFYTPLQNTVMALINSKDKITIDSFTNQFGEEFEKEFNRSIFNAIDLELEEKWGITGLSGLGTKGFTANIAHAVMNRGEFLEGEFAGIARDFAIANISRIVDKRLGLPSGTAYRGYTIYKAYKAYQEALSVAQSTIRAVNEARATFLGSRGVEDGVKLVNAEAKAADAATKAATAKVQFKAAVITIATEILLSVFAEDLAKLDAQLGVPPGTISGVISLGVTAYVTELTGAGPVGIYIAVAILLYTAIFGFSRVEFQITCPQDTLGLGMNAYYSGSGNVHPMTYINYGSYCREDDPPMYTMWAQINTRNLLYELLIMGGTPASPTFGKLTTPSIIGTFRKEDVEFFNGATNGRNLVQKAFGPPGIMRGVRGMYQSDYMSGFVHVGY